MDLWGQVRGEIEARYNHEPNWKAATSADYVALLGQAGFRDIAVGYQDATDAAARGNAGFGATSTGVFRSWAVRSVIRFSTLFIRLVAKTHTAKPRLRKEWVRTCRN